PQGRGFDSLQVHQPRPTRSCIARFLASLYRCYQLLTDCSRAPASRGALRAACRRTPLPAEGIRMRAEPGPEPVPAHPLGAGGEKAGLRVVAEHADLWNCPGAPLTNSRAKSRVLDEHVRAIERDRASMERSMQVIVSRDDAAAAARTLS